MKALSSRTAENIHDLLDYNVLSAAGLLGLALSLHRRVPAAGLFAAAFAVLPIIYYVITVQARFRHPIEPLIDIFSVYLFRNADRTRLFSFPRRSSTHNDSSQRDRPLGRGALTA